MIGCEIVKATHKGYVVSPSASPYEGRPILCAGSLDECLKFIRDEFEKLPKEEAA